MNTGQQFLTEFPEGSTRENQKACSRPKCKKKKKKKEVAV